MRLIALSAAIGSSVVFGLGSVLQKAAADSVTTATSLDPRLLVRLLKRWRYVLGQLADVSGWVLQIVALTALPLFVVQSFVAMGTGFTAVFARVILGSRLTGAGRRALGLMVPSAILIALAAPPDKPTRFSGVGFVLVSVALGAVIVTGSLVARRTGTGSGTMLGVLAGSAFSLVAILDKGVAPVPDGGSIVAQLLETLATPAPYLLLAAGLAATLLYSTGLQRGNVVAIEAPLVATELAIPSLIGVTLLGERLPADWLLLAGGVGIIGALVASVRLASERSDAVVREDSGRRASRTNKR